MAPRATIPVLVAGMLVTGIGNSIFSKWQDMQCVAHCAPGDEARRVDFSQPVWQTAQMFLGECLCLIPPMMMALWAWITRPRPGFFKGGGGGGGGEYEALGQSPAMHADLEGLDDEAGDSGFSALGADDDPHANSSAFSFLMPSHWLGEEGSSSAFSRLVPAFWPVWKAPTPAPTLGRGNSFRPGTGNANNVWGERVPANATASARAAPPAGGEAQPAAAAIPEPHQIVDEPEEDDGTKLKGKAIFLFVMPAACDICGTTLMNVGLLFTPVSIYQMTRGALVLWVGVFSVIFLQRQLFLFQWLSLLTVMLGVCIVGLSGTLLQPGAPASLQGTFVTVGGAIASRATAHASGEDVPDTAKAFIGVLLILFAQLFTAGQFVLEEKIMSRYSVEPLLAVGYEGLFGFIATLAAQLALHHFYGKTPAGRGGYFDMLTGWHQMVQSRNVLLGGVAICLSIALFNFFGLSVTRTVSATARSTIDTCRTLGIWAVSLVLGWEVFRPLTGSLQLLGFALLCGATLLFNGVIGPRYLPRWLRPGRPALARLRSRSRSRIMHRSRSRSRVPSAYNPLPTDEEEVRRFSSDQN